MPHDMNGNLLKPGDRVSMWFDVKVVQTGDEYCNLTLESVEPMYPGNSKTGLSVNAKQVALIPAAAVAPQ
jgi:hypothetical protein